MRHFTVLHSSEIRDGNSIADFFLDITGKNIRLSDDIVSDSLNSDRLPIIFHILDHVRTKNVKAPREKFTD
jgi:hypothetical protein